jgi:hypothetical protein
MSPEKNVFSGLDLLQLAKKEYGQGATVTLAGSKSHLYDWKAVVNGQQKSLNFAQTYRSIYGNQFLCFGVGVHAYDWKIIDLNKFKTNNYVVPILMLTTDTYTDIEGVRKQVAAIEKMMGNLQDFYFDKSSRWMKWVSPLMLISSQSSATVEAAAKKGGNTLLEMVEAEIKKSWDMKQLYDISQSKDKSVSLIAFTTARVKDSSGKPADPSGNGGRGRGNFCVLPPVAINYPMSNYQTMGKGSKEDAAFYVLAHEGGHAMGLPHTCHSATDKKKCLADPLNAKSIMREDIQLWVANNGATLGPSDIVEVKKQKVFRYTSL